MTPKKKASGFHRRRSMFIDFLLSTYLYRTTVLSNCMSHLSFLRYRRSTFGRNAKLLFFIWYISSLAGVLPRRRWLLSAQNRTSSDATQPEVFSVILPRPPSIDSAVPSFAVYTKLNGLSTLSSTNEGRQPLSPCRRSVSTTKGAQLRCQLRGHDMQVAHHPPTSSLGGFPKASWSTIFAPCRWRGRCHSRKADRVQRVQEYRPTHSRGVCWQRRACANTCSPS
jgi:hypothetical protein